MEEKTGRPIRLKRYLSLKGKQNCYKTLKKQQQQNKQTNKKQKQKQTIKTKQ